MNEFRFMCEFGFHYWPDESRSARRGFVLVAVVVVLSISLALFGVWAKSAVQLQQRSRNEQIRLQTVRLAEAGVRRGLAQIAVNTDYDQETWSLPVGGADSTRAAEVRIRVVPVANSSLLQIRATAEYPHGVARRAQITRQLNIELPEPRNPP